MTRVRRLRLLLMVGACVALAATFARPRLALERPTYRYVFVFDITQSMNVVDMPAAAPSQSRLAFARQAARAAVAQLPCGTQVGLALFSGHRAFLLITPVETCANYGELVQMIDAIDWRMAWESRSEVAKGLFNSIELLGALDEDDRLVFFSDGHEAPPLNPDTAPAFRGEAGAIGGLVVGVGGTTPVPIPKFDDDGQPAGFWRADEVLHVDSFTADQRARAGEPPIIGTEHLSSLREPYLQGLARDTGLGYRRLEDATDFARSLARPALGIPATVSTDMRWLFALLALLAFAAAFVLGPPSAMRGGRGAA